MHIDPTIKKKIRFTDSLLLPVSVILLTLGTLGGVVLGARHLIRDAVRAQIAGRDVQLLYQLWQNQQAAPEGGELLAPVSEDPQGQLTAILESTRRLALEDIVAARLYTSEGGRSLVAFPAWVQDADLRPDDLGILQQLRPLSRFEREADWDKLFLIHSEPKRAIPVLHVFIPLHRPGEKGLLGVAQVVFAAAGVAQEFAALDRTLASQAWSAFLGGGLVVSFALGFSFYRLRKSNRLLADRTHRLLEANQELSLSAKTSAIGSVSAHLIHGLKNPLTGLQSFMSGLEHPPSIGTDTEWKTAIRTTQRMQELVREVVRVLAEEKGAIGYEVGLDELAEMVARKSSPLAEQTGVRFVTHLTASGMLMNREANLVMLILENLIANAIQATPRQKCVTLILRRQDEQIIFEVADQGAGFPPLAREQLFKPCQSRKEGGSGIGLAISKQLANYLGATLELQCSSAAGCIFELMLPAKICEPHFAKLAANRN